jgi:hypothetical protein
MTSRGNTRPRTERCFVPMATTASPRHTISGPCGPPRRQETMPEAIAATRMGSLDQFGTPEPFSCQARAVRHNCSGRGMLCSQRGQKRPGRCELRTVTTGRGGEHDRRRHQRNPVQRHRDAGAGIAAGGRAALSPSPKDRFPVPLQSRRTRACVRIARNMDTGA